MMDNQIIVSAIGYNSVYGTGESAYWEQFKNQERNDGSSAVIGVVDPQKYMNVKGQKYLNKASLIYCNIAFQCVDQRGLANYIKEFPDKVGLYDSSELSNIDACFQFDLIAKNEGPDYVSPMSAPNTIANAAASQMAIQAGIKGPNFTLCSGANSSLQALDIACLHLKQNIVDFAVVGSTEVINKYQTAVRRGEKRNSSLESKEQGAALLVEKMPVNGSKNDSTPLAVLLQFSSGTQLEHETQADFLWRLISQVIGKSGKNTPVHLCVLAGGAYAINELAIRNKLSAENIDAPFAFPEKLLGAGDNAGGILGIMYAIGLFQGKVPPIYEDEKPHTTPDNVLVISVDTAGGGTVVLVANPNKTI
jgi:3-oxoacyl-[acyl-carrier-protein] synthase II